MNRFLLACIPPLVCLGLAGCLLGSSAPLAVHSYEMGVTDFPVGLAKPHFQDRLQVLSLANLSSAKAKMITRTSDVAIDVDEFNRWAQSPEEMVSRRLYLGVRASGLWPEVASPYGATSRYCLTGNLLRFERTADNKAHCEIELNLEDNTTQRTLINRIYSESHPMAGPTQLDFARAMTATLDRVIADFVADASALPATAGK